MERIINFVIVVAFISIPINAYPQKLHDITFLKNEVLEAQAGLFETITVNKRVKSSDTTKWLIITVANKMKDISLVLMRNDTVSPHSRTTDDLGFDINMDAEELHHYRNSESDYIVKKLRYGEQHSFLTNLTQEFKCDLISKKRYSNNQYKYTFLYRIYSTNFMASKKDSIINGRDWWFEYTVPPHIQLCNFDCEAIDTTEKHIMYSDEQKAHEAKKKESFWQKIKSFFSALF
jgi:hypothetical protein